MNKKYFTSWIKVGFISCFVLIGLLLLSNVVFAEPSLSDSELEHLAQDQSPFYEPCGGSSDSGEMCGTNQNYAGEQVWTDAQLEAIKANQPFYEKAAAEYGIAWQLLAVIHQREHGLARSNPSNGQGVYQFYSASERAACKGGVFMPGKISDDQFQIQTNCAAKRIKENYGAGLDLNTDNGVKKMFFKYNGMATAYINQALRLGFTLEEANNGEGSPYVMNRYDAKREPSSTWGQIKRDGGGIEYPANKDFGAFVLYKAIACDSGDESSSVNDAVDDVSGTMNLSDYGKRVNSEETSPDEEASEPDIDSEKEVNTGLGSGVSCDGDEKGNMNINETALELAWPLGTPEKKYHTSEGWGRTEAYAKAVKELGLSGHGFTKIPDCGCFVTAVVRYSGVDPHFKKCGAGKANLEYAKKHQDIWEVIPWNGDRSKVKAGDVITAWKGSGGAAGQHSFIIVEQDGKMLRADAHYMSKKWGAVTKLSKHYSFGTMYILRAKNGNNSVASAGGVVANNGQNNGDIGASALALAWPEGTPASTYRKRATDKFREYFSTMPAEAQAKGTCYADGKSCDRFAYTAVRYSGVEGPIDYGRVDSVLANVEKNEAWEEVKMSNYHSLEEYKSGDLLFFGHGSSADTHVAIYAEDTSGKGHVVQGSMCEEFGITKGTGGITSNYWNIIRVFRNKYNGTAEGQCDVCAGDNTNGGGLKEGGMTLEEAEEWIKIYHDAAMGKYYRKNVNIKFPERATISKADCPFGVMNNCVAFSQWFINEYTTVGPDWANTTNGVNLVGNLVKIPGIEPGTEPRPYAVFSKVGPTAAGHTGVILGVDTDREKVVVGEASCSWGRSKLWYEPRAYEYSFSEIKSWIYAYTDNVIKLGGL